MRQSFKLLSTSGLLLMTLWSAGCATTTINSGLQAGDLPPVGDFTAENGLQFNIQPLNLATLPPPSAPKINNDIYNLIQRSTASQYSITKGDILAINVAGYEDVPTNKSNHPVDQQGYIQFPLIGRISAAGMTVPQFTQKLQSQLRRYLKFPDPQVNIVEYRGNRFFIDGEVSKPGEYPIADAPVSLYSALSAAGGATDLGDSNSIVLNRNGRNYDIGLQELREIGASGNQIYIQDGDSIHVNSQERNKVYVLGEFGQIDPVPILEQGLTLAQVIGETGGLNSFTADAAKIYVVRDNPGYRRTNIYYVDMQNLTSFALANRFEMQPNDILYVDPTGLTRWNRVISSILPSTSAIRSFSNL
jgi:polysaccharide export outer membrane protein